MKLKSMINESNILSVSEDKNPLFFVFVANMLSSGKTEDEIKVSAKLKKLMSRVRELAKCLGNEKIKEAACNVTPAFVLDELKKSNNKKAVVDIFCKCKDVMLSNVEKFSEAQCIEDCFCSFLKSEEFEEFFK